MPVLVIPAGAVLIAALFALLLLLCWDQFAKALAALVPSWHLPGTGSIRDWITGHIHEAYSSVAGYLDKYVSPLTKFIVAPVVVLTGLFNEAGALDHALFDFGVRIIKVTVPRAVAVLRGEAAALERRVKAYALILKAESMVYAHGQALWALAQATDLYREARALSVALYNQSSAFTRTEVALAEAAAVTLYHDARAFSTALYNQSTAFTRSEIAGARADAAALFRQAQATVELRFGQAEAYAEAAAAAAASAAVAGLTGALVTDLDVLWPVAVGAIDDVIDVAEGAFTDAVSDLRGLAREIPDSLPAAIATSIAVAIPLLRLAKDCTIPNCRNLSQVGRDFQALFGAFEAGGLLALVAAAARDPEGTAHLLNDTLGPITRTAADEARRLVNAA